MAKTRGQIAYEAWNADYRGSVPWHRLDARDHEHHEQWAAEYEQRVSEEKTAGTLAESAHDGGDGRTEVQQLLELQPDMRCGGEVLRGLPGEAEEVNEVANG